MATVKCDNCGRLDAKLLTRQNPKGATGIFWCEVCTGKTRIVDRESALEEALKLK